MRKFAVLVLLLCFFALGTGLAEHAHNLIHASEDAALAARSGSRDSSVPIQHDDNNCPIHARLHQALPLMTLIALFVCLGLFVAFLSELPIAPHSHRIPLQLVCRGPPAC